MSKQKSKYVCQSCGAFSPRWVGRCPECHQYETFIEEIIKHESDSKKIPVQKISNIELKKLSDVSMLEEPRLKTNIVELDRVLGGGIMQGSIVLVAGDPGVGKSTIMAQMCMGLADKKIMYVTGEESLKQVKIRTQRIGQCDELLLLAETDLQTILNTAFSITPEVIIIDSIQTLNRDDLESASGSVTQVRECTASLMKYAKSSGTSVFLIGHVTKDGNIAGPKVLEHMVDTVLQFEGERTHIYRILRAVKNRFGSTNEIGVFEMKENGLKEVNNPSAIFLAERSYGSSGSSVTATLEGTRPILLEAQALVTKSSYGVPQRSATGFDYKRLQMIIAVLEKRLGLSLGTSDVFVNIAGGVRVDDTAVDAAVASAIVSSFRDIPTDSQSVIVGEVGLGGEIRAVSQIEQRISESIKLGFKTIIIPESNLKSITNKKGIQIEVVNTISDVIKKVL
jgi:DNA repair protein RadA/Sms